MLTQNFIPDYQNLVSAARRMRPKRLPLYEHSIGSEVLERLTGLKIKDIAHSMNAAERREGLKNMLEAWRLLGYDCASFEFCITDILPGGGCLIHEHQEPVIKTMADLERYPWDALPDIFFERYGWVYDIIREELPAGMKLIGGVGNGPFECAQDIIGFVGLCYMKYDDPELYDALFNRIGVLMQTIWSRFLQRFGDIMAVCRVGDDYGFKSQTMLPNEDIRRLIVPHFRALIEEVHRYNKPFLLHSCGNIALVMNDFIKAGIDAKHSNEDAICPFTDWPEQYGDKIAVFGGIDVDYLCRKTPEEVRKQTLRVLTDMEKWPGFAFGTGNSVPDYANIENYTAMLETARKFRGE